MTLKEARREFEAQFIRETLRINHGNIAAAAQMLGTPRSRIYAVTKRHGIDPHEFLPKKPTSLPETAFVQSIVRAMLAGHAARV